LFAAYGYNIGLMSQPKIIKTLRADHRWTVEELCDVVPRAFAVELAENQNDPGFGEKMRGVADDLWVEVGPGLRFWGTKLEPYGEQVW
ncbi:MAG TPA: hypothetical protein VIL85_14320, partial [Thermomicrobiales bacterium]